MRVAIPFSFTNRHFKGSLTQAWELSTSVCMFNKVSYVPCFCRVKLFFVFFPSHQDTKSEISMALSFLEPMYLENESRKEGCPKNAFLLRKSTLVQ